MKAKWLIFILAFPLISINAFAADGDLIVNGQVGVGTTTPASKLDVNGGVRVGAESSYCDQYTEGTIRFNSTSKNMEFCNGTTWKVFTSQ